MNHSKLSYQKAGVNVEKADQFAKEIGRIAKPTQTKDILHSIGGFASIARIPKGYKKPLLVTATDGVGTKLLLAQKMGDFSTIGIDLVAMSVNDLLTIGAQPYLFLDYYAIGRLDVVVAKQIIRGIAKGCKQSACSLVGGETAEMPQVYAPGEFDLAGFAVGLVEEKNVIDGSKIRFGDVILGLPSSGLHSNGYSLVRAILQKQNLSLREIPKGWKSSKTLGQELLQPTEIYVSTIMKLMKKVNVVGMVHITGGGMEGNISRILPKNCKAIIETPSWKVPKLFQFLQEQGNVETPEMYRTFNMGIGYAVIVPKKDVNKALKEMPKTKIIGTIEKRKKSEAKVKMAW